jgi:hypothetical protein
MSLKVRKTDLVKMIREEIEQVLYEVGLCHDPDTGHFDDCDPGNVYSLTRKGARDSGVSDDYVQRGTVTKKEKRKPPKVKAKFGLNTSGKKSGGRKKISGQNISPKYMVSRYPETYSEAKGQKFNPDWKSAKERKKNYSIGKPSNRSWFHGYDEMDKLARGVGLGIFEDSSIRIEDLTQLIRDTFKEEEVVEEAGTGDRAKCASMGYLTMAQAQKRILIALNQFALASDGKLNDPNVRE